MENIQGHIWPCQIVAITTNIHLGEANISVHLYNTDKNVEKLVMGSCELAIDNNVINHN